MFAEIESRCSPRVGDLLRSGLARRDPERTCPPEELRRMLTERRLPVYDSVLRFEEIYGGIVIEGEGYENDLELGCFARLSDLAPDSGSAWCERDGEVLVTIGTAYNELCMGPRGDVVTVGMDDAVIDVATSFEKYLENRAMTYWLARWCPTFLQANVRPALGEGLVKALHLGLLADASDALNSWWVGAEHVMAEHRGRNRANTGCSYVWARSLDGLSAALRAARAIHPVGVVVVARDWRREVVRGADKDRIVAPRDVSQAAADALALPYDPGDPHFSGVVELRGEPGAVRVEQYRYGGGKLVGWDSLSDEARVTRTMG